MHHEIINGDIDSAWGITVDFHSEKVYHWKYYDNGRLEITEDHIPHMVTEQIKDYLKEELDEYPKRF